MAALMYETVPSGGHICNSVRCFNAGKRERDKGIKGINERKERERRMTIGTK
jgi:hypothetical protein